jgi:hypothetical protein
VATLYGMETKRVNEALMRLRGKKDKRIYPFEKKRYDFSFYFQKKFVTLHV